MATQLPVRALRPLNRRCLLNRPPIRTFSSTRPHAKGRVPQDPDALLERNEHIAKAPSTLMHESAAESLPEDIGMINGHFITPAWRNLPSFWSNKGYYLKILFSKPISVFTLWQYVMEKKNRPRPTIGITKQVEFKEEAEKLYEKLYDSFARGDNAELRKICLPPLADQLSERIRARDGLHMEWHLEKFVRTKIMSQRGAVLGMDSHPESAYRQLVLKMVTDQVLRISAPNNIPRTISPTTSRLAWAPGNAPSKAKRRASEKEVKTEAVPHKKRVTEYLVLQKRMVKGEEDKEWKIWGFANETTPQTIKEELALEKSFRDFQTRQFMA